MKITVLTLFPEFFDSFISTSITKRAIEKKRVELEFVNFRDFSLDKHHNVDDTPYGGGAGMLLSVQPIADAIKKYRTPRSVVVLMTPQGKSFHQSIAKEFANFEHLIIVCGHYEGFDERIRNYVDLEVSIGDYVLTGGEASALVVCDAVIRLIDGVITKDSHQDDSFEEDLLEYPQYTRPLEYDGMKVPDVLLSGHHENIRKWRLQQSIKRTYERRPDLLTKKNLTKEEEKVFLDIKNEEKE